jgi:hypothetical protein
VIKRHGLSAAVLKDGGVAGLVPVFEEIVSTIDLNRSATLNTTIEAAVIANTYKEISRVLIHIARKLTSTAGAAVVTAAVDGPLPVGDIIGAVLAAGGMTWTAVDIHQAVKQQRKLPGKIDRLTQHTLTEIERAALGVVRQSCQPAHIPKASLVFSSKPPSEG